MIDIKANKGITVSSLALTIIIMLILAGTTIYMTQNQSTEVKSSQKLTELQVVNHAVYERYAQYATLKDITLFVGTRLTSAQVSSIASSMGVTLVTIPNSYTEQEKAYYSLDKANLLELGIDVPKDVDPDNYIVNYITGEVLNATIKQTESGKVLYTYSRNTF